MTSDHYVEDPSLSVAWARAVQVASRPGRTEIGPLTVSITGFDSRGIVTETPAIRSALEDILVAKSHQTIETVANTIFPNSLWNAQAPREQLFMRYSRAAPRIKKASTKNRHGIYFDRMIAGGPNGENQLEHAISTFIARPSGRRSALQIAIFDPNRDHSDAALRGFPCLQHVTLAPCDGRLNVNAFYATQYLVERAYGNYLGLCRLGRFAAHYMGIPLGRVTCLIGIAQCEAAKTTLVPVLQALDEAERVPDHASTEATHAA